MARSFPFSFVQFMPIVVIKNPGRSTRMECQSKQLALSRLIFLLASKRKPVNVFKWVLWLAVVCLQLRDSDGFTPSSPRMNTSQSEHLVSLLSETQLYISARVRVLESLS